MRPSDIVIINMKYMLYNLKVDLFFKIKIAIHLQWN